MAKLTNLITLSLQISCKLSIQSVSWKYLLSLPLHWNLLTELPCGT